MLNGKVAVGGRAAGRVGGLDHGRVHRLKEADLVADIAGGVAGRAQGEGFGQGQDGVRVSAMRRLLGLFVGFALRCLVLSGQNPVQCLGQGNEALVRGAGQSGRVIETVEHSAQDIQPLEQGGDGFGLVNPGLLLIRF